MTWKCSPFNAWRLIEVLCVTTVFNNKKTLDGLQIYEAEKKLHKVKIIGMRNEQSNSEADARQVDGLISY